MEFLPMTSYTYYVNMPVYSYTNLLLVRINLVFHVKIILIKFRRRIITKWVGLILTGKI